MKKKIVITSKFNIMNGSKYAVYSSNETTRLQKDWIDNRVDIFMNFTFQSLIHQTNQDFTALYAYDDTTEEFILDALSMYDDLPSNIIFVKASEYMNVLDKLTLGYDYLYLTRLDSDDLYSVDFVQKLHDFPIKDTTEELLCQFGYIYDSVNNQIANYYHKQFTFYTFIYRLYSENIKYDSLSIDPWTLLLDFSHFKTLDYNYELIPGRNFIFNIHSENTVSKFEKYDYGFNRVDTIITNPIDVLNILIHFF